ncbi:MAG TPA: biotin carboxylase N-terminal domain-containing protein [Polyangiaceae bacterium]|nr:biotin carboxylase N-terminal domain-containing protein [Polyangiaceae bacterium]
MFKKLLIANRGEIAIRVARTARELGVASAAVYTDVDRESLHVRRADEAWPLGENPRAYLDAERLVDTAVLAGCDALHPGYGFLSENADFAELCAARGVTFVGPPSEAIRVMGEKQRARATMAAAGVPVVPGGSAETLDEARATAARVGYPLLVKAANGGGGKGMRLVMNETELPSALERARSEAEKAFGSATVYIERALEGARHVEVQVLGDREGTVVHLGERDCSLQRRHQKILEETPCPVLDPKTREALFDVALKGARAIGYFSAGTFEFLLDRGGNFYFLEMNTRLQVEHPITELVTGVDLVRAMLEIAAGARIPAEPPIRSGAAIEARITAEDPSQGFAPSPGTIEHYVSPSGPGVREDGGVQSGSRIGSDYDPLLSKICVWAPDRKQALLRMRRALGECVITGLSTNLDLLDRLVLAPRVQSGDYDTAFVERELGSLLETATPRAVSDEVLAAAAAAFVARRESTETTRRPEPALSPWVTVERAARLDK